MKREVIRRAARESRGKWLLLDYWRFAINSSLPKNQRMSHKELAKELSKNSFERRVVMMNGSKNVFYRRLK